MEVKRRNRMNEHWLTTAEKASAMAALSESAEYPEAKLRQAWKDVLFNQFHDILPGTSIHRAYEDVDTIYDRAESALQDVTEAALAKLAASADTQGAGQPLLIFNPLSWRRTDLASIILDYDVIPASIRVRDSEGRTVPGQVVRHQKIYDAFERCKIVFIAKDVPPLGYGVYWLEALNRSETPLRVLDSFRIPITEELYKAYTERHTYWQQARPRASQSDATLAATGTGLENEVHRVRLDPKTGHVVSVTDKRSARELIPAGQAANRLELMEEHGGGGDAWTLDLTGQKTAIDRPSGITVEANGPVLASLLISYVHGNSIFDQRIALYDGLDRIDMVNQTEWRERGRTLKVRWPLAISTDKAAWEIPYAWIRKPATGREVPAQRWMDVSGVDYGVSMLNDGRYGHDCKDATIGITLLRSSICPDPVADAGVHAVTYSLWPHAGAWDPTQTVRRAEELNAPLMTRAVAAHPGRAKTFSLLRVDSATAIVSAVKQAYDGSGWVIRIWEPAGKGGPVSVTFDKPIVSAEEINLIEDPAGPATVDGSALKFDLRPHEIKTFRIKL
jgi:alpha-mannosidase